MVPIFKNSTTLDVTNYCLILITTNLYHKWGEFFNLEKAYIT